MISDDFGMRLHDRATRGETLSDEEQLELNRWYDNQDKLETTILGVPAEERTIVHLQSQIEVAISQLMTITRRIQEVASENEALRREISSLRHQLADSSAVNQAV